MHYDSRGVLVFSPSDLVAFWESEFAAWMDRWQVERQRGVLLVANDLGQPLGVTLAADIVCSPDADSEEMQFVASMGQQHEASFLAKLISEGHAIEEIARDDQAAERTLEAMRRGAAFIYQGRLQHGDFAGFADFLAFTNGPSSLGEHHYEPWDTKLAKTAKPSFIVQLCAYAELLEAIQGRLPERFEIVIGTGEQKPFLTKRYYHYYRALKRAWLEFHRGFEPQGFPNPALSTSYGRWSTFAQAFLHASDHLSQTANITHSQIKKLEAAGITTLTELATSPEVHIPGLHPAVFERLQVQASVQLGSRGKERPVYKVRSRQDEQRRHGLTLLPPKSPNDVFFDIEGFPLVDGGLEYLFGAVSVEANEPRFSDWWAHDAVQERKAFCEFISWAYARWKADPTMHIYHYASYETTAVRRLMGKHAASEREVDDLLRNHVFVDLFNVVRQGIVIGTPGYSLKDIECLYMHHREGGVTTAGGSVVAYHHWLESGESQNWRDSPRLREIRDYNEVDCVSTWKLAEWLRNVQQAEGIQFIPPPPPRQKEDANSKTGGQRAGQLAAALLKQVDDGEVSDPVKAHTQQLLAWLLEYHWREAKPVHWWMFERHAMTEHELYDDFNCLAGLGRTSTPPRPVGQSLAYEFGYEPAQETKLYAGSRCYFAHDLNSKTTIETLDAAAGKVEIKLGPNSPEPPSRLSLIPDEFLSAQVIADAIYRFVDSWRQGVILSQAVDDLLHRRLPRISGHAGGPIVPPDAEISAATSDVVRRMENTVLCIQGPPGAGKTYTAAQAILALAKAGKRVGVTATSHKAILNVLRAVHEAREKCGTAFRIVKIGSDEGDPLIASGEILHKQNSGDAGSFLDGRPLVMGGTAWLFARDDVQGEFDTLFIDEAGQFSLANAVAMGQATKNLVLVGDQMQLAQPIQGSHPGESGQSVLNYLLDGKATIPPEFGIFLDRTWRLHPDICSFVSDAFYDGRLKSHPRTASQRIETNGGQISKEAGIAFYPVEHFGNAQGSEEEIEFIEQLVRDLLGRKVCESADLPPRPLTRDDILVIAPFNMQVRQLQERLGPRSRVGSVDKFQGQEAHVVIVSMCSSTLEDSPRGAEFLLEPNRLNVAVSRAKTLAVVVACPNLASARCRTIKEMELVNLFCWLVEHSLRGIAETVQR